MRRNSWSSEMQIGERKYGGFGPVYVIAEIGSNHSGSLEKAKELIAACAESGVNAVKFQSWTSTNLQNTKDVNNHGVLSESSVIPILKKYEVPEEWHIQLYEHCLKMHVDFLSTPFDIGKARLLRSLSVPAIKIASGDLTYDDLLEEVGTYDTPIILSTGMATLGEIEHALKCLGSASKKNVILLHCTAAYPPNIGDANILSIRTLADTFGLPVGISDHYLGPELALASVALGAIVVEKHVTFSRDDGSPDSPFATEIAELKAMVASIRSLEVALGDGEKRCRDSEAGGLVGGRRSLFAARDIKLGSVITRGDIAVVRPNISEIKPSDVSKVIGKLARSDIPKGTPLSWMQLNDN